MLWNQEGIFHSKYHKSKDRKSNVTVQKEVEESEIAFLMSEVGLMGQDKKQYCTACSIQWNHKSPS